MKIPMQKELRIVVAIGQDGNAILEERTIGKLLEVLNDRAVRLVRDQEICERLRPVLRKFVHNIIYYFHNKGELDDYVMTNIMTALVTSDSHGPSNYGVEDYSTFIRRPNPTDPDADRYFVIGRVGRISDPVCPLNEMEKNMNGLSEINSAQLHMYRAFHYARSKDASRGAPRIPIEDFTQLVPIEVSRDPVLEEAFTDVCFSDGAWELYQLKWAA